MPSRRKKFDPEGSGYDYESAQKAGIKPDDTGHWPSFEGRSGMMLKGRRHESIGLTEEAEDKLGREIHKKGGRYYSRKIRRVP